MVIHSSIPARKILWIEENGGLQSLGDVTEHIHTGGSEC